MISSNEFISSWNHSEIPFGQQRWICLRKTQKKVFFSSGQSSKALAPHPPRLSGQKNGYKLKSKHSKKVLFFLSGNPLIPSTPPPVDCPLKKRTFIAAFLRETQFCIDHKIEKAKFRERAFIRQNCFFSRNTILEKFRISKHTNWRKDQERTQ